MPRPHKCRFVGADPAATVFKPRGIPSGELTTVELRRDELEAIRLADLEGLYQDDAAARMGISRATFGRLLQSARTKVADALMNGRMIVFEGGVIEMIATRTFSCLACGETFNAEPGTGRPPACPSCGSTDFHRVGGPGPDAPGCGGPGGRRVQARRRRRHDGSGRAARSNPPAKTTTEKE